MHFSTEATHKLDSRGEVSSARFTCNSHCRHLLAEEPRIGVVISKVEMQLVTEASYVLVSQGPASSVGSKCKSLWKPLTRWRVEDRRRQHGPIATHMEAIHKLESRGHAS